MAIRRTLEAFHGRQDPAAVDAAWPHLASPDRVLRSAARIAIEHQPVDQWRERALSEKDPQASITAMIALARASAQDPVHRKPSDPQPDPSRRAEILAALQRIDWKALDEAQRLELLRAYGLTFTRLGPPDAAGASTIIAKLDPHYPATSQTLNSMLSELLIYLQAPTAAAKTVALLAKAPTQEEQLDYAKSLRMLKTGWTMDQRRQYMEWFQKAAGYRGGASFGNFVANIKKEAVAALPPDALAALKPVIEAKPNVASPQAAFASVLKGRTKVKEWNVDDLAPAVARDGLAGRDFDRGRQLFGAVGCFACHRFANEGGAVGPDLTGVAGRFGPRDLLESIILPHKEISDQYAQVAIVRTKGDPVVGRIVNLAGDSLRVMTNMYDPNDLTSVDTKQVKSIRPSKLSPMPEGLLNLLEEDEVLDLMAYLLSGGDRGHKMFAGR